MVATTEGLGVRGAMRAPPLLLTKMHPPPQRAQTVVRDRLVERLRASPEVRLTVVAAPAGYGKTTLLGTWRELEAETRPVAWLTLDEGDNDPVVLWSYILAALRTACPELGVTSSPDVLGAPHILDLFLPVLVNELAALGDAAIVLDDFHRLTNGPARDSIAWLVERAPSTFRVVLATRTEPALPLASLRAHGDLLELRADELGFTSAEADVLLNDRLDLGLDLLETADLVARTEGWPTGLYLAALSARAAADPHEFVGRFGAGSRQVVDFLMDQVLEAHDPETQALMLRTSVLGRLSGSLCDAVLEQTGSEELLEALARTNLFLIPLDDCSEWYRFHHVFASLLRVELEHREPGLAPTLHRRASAWHRDHGSVTEAIEHAIQAEAFDEAGDLIAAAWADYMHVNREATVLGWLERFPRERLNGDARLLLASAWVNTLSGQREAAAEAMAAIELMGRLDEGPLPDGFSSIEASLVTLRGFVMWGDVGAGMHYSRRAAELEGPESPWRPTICASLGLQTYHTGDFDESEAWFGESVELARSRGQWSIASFALAFRSLVAGDDGRFDDQRLLAEEAVDLARRYGFEGTDGAPSLAAGAALATQQRFEEALAMLERSLGMLRAHHHPLPIAIGLYHYIAVLQAMSRPQEANDAIAEANAILGGCPDPGLWPKRLAALERPRQPPRRNGTGTLSVRELSILRMLTGTLSERDIGRELYLSQNTVHSHVRSIYRKLGVSSRSAALDRARELNHL